MREPEGAVIQSEPITTADQAVIDFELGHGQALFGFVRRQGLSDSEAQDAVQEVLLRLWRELRSEVPIENPRAWAYRAIYRLAMDQHRLRRKLTDLTSRLAHGRTAVSRAEETVDRVAVWTEVDQLPLRQRQVLYLRYRADLPFDTIAAVLGITSSAARSHAAQAMVTLRTRLIDGERK